MHFIYHKQIDFVRLDDALEMCGVEGFRGEEQNIQLFILYQRDNAFSLLVGLLRVEAGG